MILTERHLDLLMMQASSVDFDPWWFAEGVRRARAETRRFAKWFQRKTDCEMKMPEECWSTGMAEVSQHCPVVLRVGWTPCVELMTLERMVRPSSETQRYN